MLPSTCRAPRTLHASPAAAVGAGVVLFACSATAAPTAALNVEAAAARSIGPTKSEQFGWGGGAVVAPELVLTRALSIELAAGALGLAAGEGEPPPGVAPTSDALAFFVALGPRVRPFADFGTDDGPFRPGGLWAAAGFGGGLTRDVARPAVRIAMGYDISVRDTSIGPFAGFFQLIEPDGGSLRPEDARVGLFGLHGTFGRGDVVAPPTAPRDEPQRAASCPAGSAGPDCKPIESDRDGDGIPDARDGCADAAEDRNGVDDDDGCPEPRDRDGDGIPDARDACPDLPGTAGAGGVDEGCPPQPDFRVEGAAIVLSEKLRFSTGEIVLDEAGLRVLGSIADFLSRHPEYTLLAVQGHTDDIGPGAFNMMLSRKRAEEVIVLLVARGVDRARLRADARGENAPLDPSPTQAARRVNRRVQLDIIERAASSSSEEAP